MRGPGVILLAALLIGCDAPLPAPTASPDLPTLQLPDGLSGVPGPDEVAISIHAHTPVGSVAVGVEQNFTLGHCGLSSPIDIDGSLWDPVAGDNGQGGPLADVHIGELINATAVILVLVDTQTALFATPAGAHIVLERHDGPRFYRGCD